MSEIALHAAIKNLLDSIGICYIYSRSDKRATNTPGTPDFIFALNVTKPRRGWTEFFACAWEIKLPKKKLRPDQEKMRERMTKSPNAWKYSVITSLDEAIAELKAMGLIC